jgi:hypothetical protein
MLTWCFAAKQGEDNNELHAAGVQLHAPSGHLAYLQWIERNSHTRRKIDQIAMHSIHMPSCSCGAAEACLHGALRQNKHKATNAAVVRLHQGHIIFTTDKEKLPFRNIIKKQ